MTLQLLLFKEKNLGPAKLPSVPISYLDDLVNLVLVWRSNILKSSPVHLAL